MEVISFAIFGLGVGGTCGEVPSKALTIFFTELLDLLSGLPFPILEPQGSSNLEAFLTPLCSNKFFEAFIRGYTFIPENTALSCKSSRETLFRSLGRPSPLLWMLEIFSMSRLDNGLSDKKNQSNLYELGNRIPKYSSYQLQTWLVIKFYIPVMWRLKHVLNSWVLKKKRTCANIWWIICKQLNA